MACVLSSFSHVRLFETPPWTVAHQAPLSMGFLQARILEWVAMPSFRGSSWPRDQTWVFCIAGRFSSLVSHQGNFAPLKSLITETCSRANIVVWLRSQNAKNGFSYIKKVMPGTLSLGTPHAIFLYIYTISQNFIVHVLPFSSSFSNSLGVFMQ